MLSYDNPLWERLSAGYRIPVDLRPLLQRLEAAENRAEVWATVFDKSPTSNWKVPWHQDVAIAVEKRVDAPGFGPWSVKEGVPHVEPPAAVLESLLALRLHLDPTPVGNGELRVAPGSHRRGKLSSDEIQRLREESKVEACPVEAGAVMAMRPLLLHASSPSVDPKHRRVLHVEYSAAKLPHGLEWATFDRE